MSLSRTALRRRSKHMSEGFTVVPVQIPPPEKPGGYQFRVKIRGTVKPRAILGGAMIAEVVQGATREYQFEVMPVGMVAPDLPEERRYVGMAVFPPTIHGAEPKVALVYQVGFGKAVDETGGGAAA